MSYRNRRKLISSTYYCKPFQEPVTTEQWKGMDRFAASVDASLAESHVRGLHVKHRQRNWVHGIVVYPGQCGTWKQNCTLGTGTTRGTPVMQVPRSARFYFPAHRACRQRWSCAHQPNMDFTLLVIGQKLVVKRHKTSFLKDETQLLSGLPYRLWCFHAHRGADVLGYTEFFTETGGPECILVPLHVVPCVCCKGLLGVGRKAPRTQS